MEVFHSKSAKDTEKFAENFAKSLSNGSVVAFLGKLGAGKTAFVRGMAKGLGIGMLVSSPTFAIMNEYHGEIPLYHFDMYRIETWEDLYSTGFFEYMEGDGILAIEWSENIENALPNDTVFVKIEKTEVETERIISTWREEKHENFSTGK